MNNKFNILFIIVLSLFYGELRAQNMECIPVKSVDEQTLPFKSGEYLSYVIKYKWGAVNTEIGEASFSIQSSGTGSDSYYIGKLSGGTAKFYDMFFKAREYYEAKFSKENLKPIYFHRDVKEGKYSVKNWIDFHPGNKIKSKVQKNNRSPKDTLLQGRDCSFDVVSLFYFVRSLDSSVLFNNAERSISIVIDGEIYNLGFRFAKRENKRIPGMGLRKTLKFSAKVIKGQFFAGDEQLHIWVSDDSNRVPLYFESPVKVGRISGRLSKYSNLKYYNNIQNLY